MSNFNPNSLRCADRKKFHSTRHLSRNLSFGTYGSIMKTGDLGNYKTINKLKSIDHELPSLSSRDIKTVDKIGEGEFGYVFEGVLFNKIGSKINVAIKKMKSKGNYEDFLREGRIMFSLKHSCILNIYGVCHDLKMIALELAKLGSMDKYLRMNSENIGLETLKLWSLQIADGNIAKNCKKTYKTN